VTPGRIESFDVSPDGGELLVVADGSGRLQPWLMPADGHGTPRLIPVDGVVLRCAWRPDGSRFIATVDLDGREDQQILEIDPADGSVYPIAAQPGVRNEIGLPLCFGGRPYSPDGRYLAYASNRRTEDCFDIVLREVGSGAERTVLTAGREVPEGRYFPASFSWDSRQLLVTRLHQQTEQDIYAVDIVTGEVLLLTPHEGPAKHYAVAAWPEGTYLCATWGGNFTGLALLTPAGDLRWIDTPERDIEYAALSPDGCRLAWAVNEDGFTSVWHCAIRDGVARDIAQASALPPDAYVFQVGMSGHALQFSADGRRLFALDGAATIWQADLETGEARAIGPRRDAPRTRPSVVRFTSSDGTLVSGLAYKPAGEGPFPVVVDIHGGPEVQAMPGSDPLRERLLARGIAVLAPNIRGSSGYGLRHQRLIYRDWGGGDVADLRAAAEFLRAQPWADPGRLAVYGASYGGFAALCCLTMLPEYWRAGVSESGPSDQVEDVRTLPLSWRGRARDWIGDIDDPADRERLRQASPITHADRVRAPVLLLHGTNDTNVAVESSDVLYARLTELGRPVHYERIDGAGHAISHQVDVPSLVCDWLAGQLL
jgi:dipeptidyl aminopeptidase/acylaminoacyl peptidase